MQQVKKKHWLRWLAVCAAVLALAFLAGALWANGAGPAPAGGQVEKGKPKAKPKAKAKMLAPEQEEDVEKDTKVKTRGLQPPPAAAPLPEAQPAKPGGSRFGGQPIRGKESQD
ncbi:MAG: hypothetical protein FJ128_07585 [Deltaproteobacteria bacterium]|nr:hypothetical protein [Deltaproteobacteria bacterium]